MQITETLRDGLKRAYELSLTAAALEELMEQKVAQTQGQAPRGEQRDMLLQETLQETLDDTLMQHFQSGQERPAHPPRLALRDPDWRPGQDVVMEVSYEVTPVIPAVDLSALVIEQPVVQVDDATIQDAIGGMINSELDIRQVAALKQQVRQQLGMQLEASSMAVVQRQALDQLAAQVDFPLPEALIESHAHHIAHEQWHHDNPNDHGHNHPHLEPTDEHRQAALGRVKRGLLLESIGRGQKITVSPEELQAAIQAEAQQYPGQEQQFMHFLQQNPQAIQQIQGPLMEAKIMDYILSQAQVTRKEVNLEQFQEILNQAQD